MGKFLVTTLFFIILFISRSASSSSSHEIQPQKPSNSKASPSQYKVFYLKNTNNPSSKQEYIKKRTTRNRKRQNMKNQRQEQGKEILKNNLNSRSFSVMLPKGFVPPSGSSPCHNLHPTSLSFHCHLSATKP